MATPKQVSFALHLLSEADYPTKFMSAKYKSLGATMQERGGRVEDWLRGLDSGRISKLIDQLKSDS